MIEGPDGSPFQSTSPSLYGVRDGWSITDCVDGVFRLESFLPEEYPVAPPRVRFLTRVHHPNIGTETDERMLAL